MKEAPEPIAEPETPIKKSKPKKTTPKAQAPPVDPEQVAADREIHSNLDEKELEKQYLIHRRQSRENSQKDSVKVIDWKETTLYQHCIDNRVKQFNYSHDPKYFTESEIDYVVQMIQERQEDFIRDNLLKAFYLKSSLTLYKLVEYWELTGTRYFDQIMSLYEEVNVENTLKLLIRSKQLCKVKDILIELFKAIHKREEISEKIKGTGNPYNQSIAILTCNPDDVLDENVQK